MDTDKKASFSLDDLTKESTLTANVHQECIVTTYDKIRLILIEYEENKKFAQNWYGYLSMAISFALPCFTADFKPFLFFSAEFLNTLFEVLAVICTILAIIGVYKRIKKRNEITIDYCANKIRNNKSE